MIGVERAHLASREALRTSRLWEPAAHQKRCDVPDLVGLATRQFTQNRARGPRAALLRRLAALLGAFPRLFRRLIDRAYRWGLGSDG